MIEIIVILEEVVLYDVVDTARDDRDRRDEELGIKATEDTLDELAVFAVDDTKELVDDLRERLEEEGVTVELDDLELRDIDEANELEVRRVRTEEDEVLGMLLLREVFVVWEMREVDDRDELRGAWVDEELVEGLVVFAAETDGDVEEDLWRRVEEDIGVDAELPRKELTEWEIAADELDAL